VPAPQVQTNVFVPSKSAFVPGANPQKPTLTRSHDFAAALKNAIAAKWVFAAEWLPVISHPA
jgi:hypothetical protein